MQASNLLHFDMKYLSSRTLFGQKTNLQHSSRLPRKVGCAIPCNELEAERSGTSTTLRDSGFATYASDFSQRSEGVSQFTVLVEIFWAFQNQKWSKMAIIVLGDFILRSQDVVSWTVVLGSSVGPWKQSLMVISWSFVQNCGGDTPSASKMMKLHELYESLSNVCYCCIVLFWHENKTCSNMMISRISNSMVMYPWWTSTHSIGDDHRRIWC